MEQASNRSYEISHATVGVKVGRSNQTVDQLRAARRQHERDVYQARKEQGLCTRCGLPASDDQLCGDCASRLRPMIAASVQRLRRQRRKRKQCARCGERSPDRYECLKCLLKLGRMPKSAMPAHGKPTVDPATGFQDRVEQSPDGKLRARRRFVGQGKRGRQSGAQLDNQDLDDAKSCMDHGVYALEYFRTDAVQVMPKVQREDVKAAAIAKLKQAQRWLGEVIDRNTPKSRKEQTEADDE